MGLRFARRESWARPVGNGTGGGGGFAHFDYKPDSGQRLANGIYAEWHTHGYARRQYAMGLPSVTILQAAPARYSLVGD